MKSYFYIFLIILAFGCLELVPPSKGIKLASDQNKSVVEIDRQIVLGGIIMAEKVGAVLFSRGMDSTEVESFKTSVLEELEKISISFSSDETKQNLTQTPYKNNPLSVAAKIVINTSYDKIIESTTIPRKISHFIIKWVQE